MPRLDRFTTAYLEAAAWTDTPDRGDPESKQWEGAGWSPEAIAQAVRECAAFCEANADALDAGPGPECAGHDFWLTRNYHGAGYWDGDWPEPAATILTAGAEKAGERAVYLGDDGALYFDPGH